MSTIQLINPTFFKANTSGVSGVVGYESKSNRIVRYELLPPPIGANHLDLTFSGNWVGAGTTPNTLLFYIGTDPGSHSNAGHDAESTGQLIRTNGTYNYTGAADIVLMPNTVYYVWVFPASTTFGWVYWSRELGDAVAQASGGAYSTLSATAGTLGKQQTLTVTRYNAGYTHAISYAVGSATGQICSKTADTEIPWTPPLDLAYQITESAQGSAIITITTYNGNTELGSLTTTVQLSVPDSVIPSVSASWRDGSPAFDLMGTLVQSVSHLVVDISAAGILGSRITGTSMTLAGEPYTGGLIAAAGAIDLIVTATDSRGRKSHHSYPISVAEYAFPTISLSAHRCTVDGVADEMGEYAYVSVSGTASVVNGNNRANIVLTYADQMASHSCEAGSISWSTIIPAPSVSSMPIKATIVDLLTSSPTAEMVLSIGYATMDFFAGGKGIAFGTTAKEPGFTCAMDANFTGGLQLGGKALVDVIYPVGSIYMSANDVSPAAFLGGTWERIENRFLLAAGSSYAAGVTGGEAAHTLTVNEMPSHRHSIGAQALDPSAPRHDTYFNSSITNAAANTWYAVTSYVGGGQAHNNMPPYLAVYIWKRIS